MEFESYIKKRIELFDKLYAKQEEKRTKKTKEEIIITLPTGEVKGKSWETTPHSLSKIHNPVHASLLVAKVNGELWDVHRPLEQSGRVEFLNFEDEEGKKVYREYMEYHFQQNKKWKSTRNR